MTELWDTRDGPFKDFSWVDITIMYISKMAINIDFNTIQINYKDIESDMDGLKSINYQLCNLENYIKLQSENEIDTKSFFTCSTLYVYRNIWWAFSIMYVCWFGFHLYSSYSHMTPCFQCNYPSSKYIKYWTGLFIYS